MDTEAARPVFDDIEEGRIQASKCRASVWRLKASTASLDVGLEGLEARPGAAVQAKGAFARGDDALDPGPPFAQLLVSSRFFDQLRQGFMFGRNKD